MFTYLNGRGLQASSSLRRRSSEREMNKRISSDIERCNVVAVDVLHYGAMKVNGDGWVVCACVVFDGRG